MEKNLIQYCRYYKGEKQCPEEFHDTPKANFWYGEKVFVSSGGDITEWEKRGQKILATLSGEKLQLAKRYTPMELGMIVYIETLFSSHDPYDDTTWIFDY